MLRVPRLTARLVPTVAGEAAEVSLRVGRVYELRCDVNVTLAPGQPQSMGLYSVRPDTPLVFVADVERVYITTATASVVVLREEAETPDDLAATIARPTLGGCS
jgi:hypothetical protein